MTETDAATNMNYDGVMLVAIDAGEDITVNEVKRENLIRGCLVCRYTFSGNRIYGSEVIRSGNPLYLRDKIAGALRFANQNRLKTIVLDHQPNEKLPKFNRGEYKPIEGNLRNIFVEEGERIGITLH